MARYIGMGSEGKGERKVKYWNNMKVSEHDGGVMQAAWERRVRVEQTCDGVTGSRFKSWVKWGITGGGRCVRPGR